VRNLTACVLLPLPSGPSNVMNNSTPTQVHGAPLNGFILPPSALILQPSAFILPPLTR